MRRTAIHLSVNIQRVFILLLQIVFNFANNKVFKNDTPALSATEFIAKSQSESPKGGDGLGAGMAHPG
jgi:hypothetical protein